MHLVLLVLHIIVTLALIIIILIQRSDSDGMGGLGGGSGGGGGFMTGRAQANLLTRTTAILATIFILNSLALSWLTQRDVRSQSVVERMMENEGSSQSVPLPSEEGIDDPLPLNAPTPKTLESGVLPEDSTVTPADIEPVNAPTIPQPE